MYAGRSGRINTSWAVISPGIVSASLMYNDRFPSESAGVSYVCWSQRQFHPVDQGAWLYIARLNCSFSNGPGVPAWKI